MAGTTDDLKASLGPAAPPPWTAGVMLLCIEAAIDLCVKVHGGIVAELLTDAWSPEG
jgi:hypothetical protein